MASTNNSVVPLKNHPSLSHLVVLDFKEEETQDAAGSTSSTPPLLPGDGLDIDIGDPPLPPQQRRCHLSIALIMYMALVLALLFIIAILLLTRRS
jgi:hypothetical protein